MADSGSGLRGIGNAMVVDWCSAVHDTSSVTAPLSHICNWRELHYIL